MVGTTNHSRIETKAPGIFYDQWGQTPVTPIETLGRHDLDLSNWAGIRDALKDGWDPREEIEKYLVPFFEYLGHRKFRCVVRIAGSREVCGQEEAEKGQMISHICIHLGYFPYACGGQCGRIGWYATFCLIPALIKY
jgi:hypothetical protein